PRVGIPTAEIDSGAAHSPARVARAWFSRSARGSSAARPPQPPTLRTSESTVPPASTARLGGWWRHPPPSLVSVRADEKGAAASLACRLVKVAMVRGRTCRPRLVSIPGQFTDVHALTAWPDVFNGRFLARPGRSSGVRRRRGTWSGRLDRV